MEADAARRVEESLVALKERAAPGSDERRRAVQTLESALRDYGDQRDVLNAFLDHEGPQVLYAVENSMQGDWITDAKNGTLRRIGEMARADTKAAWALAQYRNDTARAVQAAVAGLHPENCEH
mgnify:FL=1